MKNFTTIATVPNDAGRMMFDARLADAMGHLDEPRVYPQRKRAWDKLMSDVDKATSALRVSRASALAKM